MKLKILGKYGPYGKAGEGAASGYLITDDDFCFLLDMGSGVLSRLIAEIDVKNLDGIFISHLHYDHTSDLLPFRYLLEEIDAKIIDIQVSLIRYQAKLMHRVHRNIAGHREHIAALHAELLDAVNRFADAGVRGVIQGFRIGIDIGRAGID